MERVQILKADILQELNNVTGHGCFSFFLEFLDRFLIFSFPLFEFVWFFEFETWSKFEDSSPTSALIEMMGDLKRVEMRGIQDLTGTLFFQCGRGSYFSTLPVKAPFVFVFDKF